MFDKKKLTRLIVPLIIEQTLAVLVGMADVFMVSEAGESAVSGVSLVNTINLLLITTFGALATGGSVVISTYIGKKDYKSAGKAANQLILLVSVISIVFMVISLAGNSWILKLGFGKVEKEVMKNARIYFYITALSFPALGIYNGCAAIFRSVGNSKVSMYTSLIMNVINITGNAIFIYGMHFGAAGIAASTLIGRMAAALIMLYLAGKEKNPVHIDRRFRFGYHPQIIRSILHIGVPSGMESAMFQFGKILVQSFVAGLTTAEIAANAVAMTLVEVEVIPGHAIGLAMITVVGQCMGAGDFESMKNNVKKLMKLAYICMGSISLCLVLLCNPLIDLYQLSDMASVVAFRIILYHTVAAVLIWPLSFVLPNVFRAAGDVRYPMIVSIVSMWIFRVIISYILIEYVRAGALGVWIAMSMDWLARGSLYLYRYKTKYKGKMIYHLR